MKENLISLYNFFRCILLVCMFSISSIPAVLAANEVSILLENQENFKNIALILEEYLKEKKEFYMQKKHHERIKRYLLLCNVIISSAIAAGLGYFLYNYYKDQNQIRVLVAVQTANTILLEQASNDSDAHQNVPQDTQSLRADLVAQNQNVLGINATERVDAAHNVQDVPIRHREAEPWAQYNWRLAREMEEQVEYARRNGFMPVVAEA